LDIPLDKVIARQNVHLDVILISAGDGGSVD
jgi:hypothetical protein